MEKLIKGLHKFQDEIFPQRKIFFENLVKAQNPEVLFITCSDSRINPNLVTSTDPGDLFIMRIAGNIIPVFSCTGEWATIEFAVYVLNIKHIVICGHSHCGAIISAINPESTQNKSSILCQWIQDNIQPTLQLVTQNYKSCNKTSFVDVLTQENVLKQIENLKTHPGINAKLTQGELALHAWIYEFETGEIFAYDSIDGQFKSIKKF